MSVSSSAKRDRKYLRSSRGIAEKGEPAIHLRVIDSSEPFTMKPLPDNRSLSEEKHGRGISSSLYEAGVAMSNYLRHFMGLD